LPLIDSFKKSQDGSLQATPRYETTVKLISIMSERHEIDETLLEAFRYINSVPGKDVRGILVDCFQIWLNVTDATKLDQIKDIIGDLHNASLLIDDIEDNSKLRRGNPVAHSIFGVPNVINTANYVYFLALEKCQHLDNPQAMKVFVGELLNLHRGQGHDIVVRLSAAHTVTCVV
jgi:geranylgeranyl diphosphate synthase, type III